MVGAVTAGIDLTMVVIITIALATIVAEGAIETMPLPAHHYGGVQMFEADQTPQAGCVQIVGVQMSAGVLQQPVQELEAIEAIQLRVGRSVPMPLHEIDSIERAGAPDQYHVIMAVLGQVRPIEARIHEVVPIRTEAIQVIEAQDTDLLVGAHEATSLREGLHQEVADIAALQEVVQEAVGTEVLQGEVHEVAEVSEALQEAALEAVEASADREVQVDLQELGHQVAVVAEETKSSKFSGI